MKTVCILNGRIVMHQDGDAVTAMEENAAQYSGATVQTMDDETFVAAMAAQSASIAGTPTSVTMRQARLALLQTGKLAQVNTAVAAMPGAAGDAARIEWEFSSTVERHRPLVESLGVALGMTDAQLDDLFTLAATL